MKTFFEGDINGHLTTLAERQGFNILFAAETGSHATGLAGPNSDRDVRFVYVRPPAWYLSISNRRDVCEPSLPEPYGDTVGWDLRKALYEIHRGNPSFFEWLHSPLYRGPGGQKQMQELSRKYFNPRSAIYHYVHMAYGNYKRYIQDNPRPILKKYLFVTLPMLRCQFIMNNHFMCPIKYDKLKQGLVCPEIVDVLVEEKRSIGGSHQIDAVPELNFWLESELEKFSKLARTTAKGGVQPDDLNEYFFNQVLNGTT